MSTHRRMRLWLSWIAGLGLLAALGPLFLGWQHLPDPLATHFGASGAPNGKMSRPVFALFLTGLVLLVPVSAWRRAAKPWTADSVTGIPVLLGTAALMSAIVVKITGLILWHNWDRADWTDARPFEGGLLLLLAIPFLIGGGVAWLAHRRWPGVITSAAPFEALPIERGERAYWSGTASNRWFLLLVAALVIQAGVTHVIVAGSLIAAGAMLGVHLLLLVLLEHLSHIRVTVDERALTIRYGRLGWIKQRIGLERVAAATAFELEPWAHGGWGYRGSLKLAGRAAVVVRSGSAVRLDLRDGRRLSVTVDDATTAARLINGFVQLRGDPPASPALQKLEAPS